MSPTLEAQQLLAPETGNLATVETGNPAESLTTDFRQDQIKMLERCRQCVILTEATETQMSDGEWTKEYCDKIGCNVCWTTSPGGTTSRTGSCGNPSECDL